MVFVTLFVLLLATTYLGFMLYLCLGVILMRRDSQLSEAKPFVSVVVPLHNEEEYAQKTLECLASQDYTGQLQVICVNDRSTDRTESIVQDFVKNHEHFEYVSITLDSVPVASPKKRALENGFRIANGEIFMTMDADCEPPVAWVSSMVSQFVEGIDIVQGPKRIIPKSQNILQRFQQIDTLGFTLIEGAFFTLDNPMLASAPSLGYRRSLYEKVGGFDGLRAYVSGDDDMLVQKMSEYAQGIVYNLDPQAQVGTAPMDSWKGLFSQRARWASNGSEYDSKLYVILLLAIYLFFVWCLLAPLAGVLGLFSWSFILKLYLMKAMVDFLFLWIGGTKLKSRSLLRFFPFAWFIQIPLTVWAAPAGHFKWYRW